MSHHAVAFAMVALALVGAVAASGGEHLGTATATSVQNVSVSSTAQCSAVETARRINCYPQSGASQSGCEARGCCWSPVGTAAAAAATGDPVFVGEPDASTPWCFYPEGYGYTMGTVTTRTNGFTATLSKSAPASPYGKDIDTLLLNVTFETDTRLRVRITDPSQARYEVPIPTPVVPGTPPSSATSMDYKVTTTSNPFGLAITRVSTGQVLWNSTLGGFTYADQFIQWSSLLSSEYIYGLGEHMAPLLLPVDWTRITLFTRDQGTPPGYTNLYGVHPFYLNMEPNGDAHGVFLLNSNAMDVILQPTPAITYRTIGGIIDMYFMTGPTPEAVTAQYHKVIGTAFMPPYWSLGFHLCRWGYMTLNRTQYINDAVRAYGIPQDTQWNDIDSMNKHLDFTYDPVNYKGLPEFILQLRNEYGQHYIVITDPGISNSQPAGTYPPYDDAAGLWVNLTAGEPFVGPVWPGPCVFPDFFNPKTMQYWENQLHTFRNVLGVETDGLWIDMNEPDLNTNTVNCPEDQWTYPPYVPGVPDGNLNIKTICLNSQHINGISYDLHSLYGYSETVATMSALRSIMGERAIVIARSTFAGSGHHGGHWLGDNDSTWADLYLSIPGLLAMNMFGITLVGADICGYGGNTTEPLCNRWMQLGAFYPFSRNHNAIGNPRQDPAAFGPEFAATSRKVLLTRYRLLPFLYSLFHVAHSMGGTVARPLLFEFPTDVNTYAIDRQFLWGGALLISPVLELNATSVTAYFPNATWYDYYTGERMQEVGGAMGGRNVTLQAPLDTIPLHVRGGYIMPAQEPAITTTVSRNQAHELIVALDGAGVANGFMFTDDGKSLNTWKSGEYLFVQFNATTTSTGGASMGSLTSNPVHVGYTPPANATVQTVVVMGVSWQPTAVSAAGASVPFAYNTTSQVLTITGMSQQLQEPMKVEWK